jgi:hypothetical protein
MVFGDMEGEGGDEVEILVEGPSNILISRLLDIRGLSLRIELYIYEEANARA